MKKYNDDPETAVDNGNTVNSCSCKIFCYVELLPDTEINEKIRSLNMSEREIFDYVYCWVNVYIKKKKLNCISTKNVLPTYLLLTGGGGCRKSH